MDSGEVMGLRAELAGLAADGDLDGMTAACLPYYGNPEVLARVACDLAAQVARLSRLGRPAAPRVRSEPLTNAYRSQRG